ncbi:MAG: hypothetical protein WAM69_02970 [Candidatus Sulfotelmatobacter sp.]
MAEVVQDAQQEFWRSPTAQEPVAVTALADATPEMAEVCAGCGSEFMIGARFCHACGRRRPAMAVSMAKTGGDAAAMAAALWARTVALVRTSARWITARGRKISFPDWLHYLHFHEIKRWVGLPTAALIAFIIGLGCVAGALAVSIFYRASNLAEFQAIQMWRLEWLLAATASFVAGILLKQPSDDDRG